MLKEFPNAILVSDPPFNIGYRYDKYKDNMKEAEYFDMLVSVFGGKMAVVIHYPEALYKLSILTGEAPQKVCSWVYPSNTAKQHRDVAFFGVKPNFKAVTQPYKNPNDKRVQKLIAQGKKGARLYDWWEINQVKNVSKEKSEHPCQMPVQVMKSIIGVLPEDAVIVDPFMGSGTTGVACLELGRRFIGIDMSEKYCEIAKERLGI